MKDHFESTFSSVDRAIRHINVLDKRINKFFKKQPYARVAEKDPNGPNLLHKVKLTRSIPSGFTDLVVDAVGALRAALDQATYAATTLLREIEAKNAYFPISTDSNELENVIKGRCKDVPPEIIDAIKDFKPYNGANDLIFALNRLCNTNKHKYIVPVGVANAGTHIKNLTLSGGGSIFAPHWDNDKNEIIFASTTPGTKFNYEIGFSFFIAFGEIEIIGGQPVVPILRAMEGEVRKIVSEIKKVANDNKQNSL